jgi:NAD(P)-dependent dehydrogenase (short-subunit alcohol dehydrogenase family)
LSRQRGRISGSFAKLSTEDYRRQFDTNFFGVLDTAYAVLPHLLESKGRLGVVASVSGRLAAPGTSAYNASKFALVGYTETIYHELGRKGVSVTLINPGFIDSEIRFKDNQETIHSDWKDSAPGWLVLPADRAARQIVTALYKQNPKWSSPFTAKF